MMREGQNTSLNEKKGIGEKEDVLVMMRKKPAVKTRISSLHAQNSLSFCS